MPEKRPIRVLLVDDHSILREGLRAMLHYYSDVVVAGEAQDGLEAVEMVEAVSPDVVLMDIAMPSMNGIEATRRIVREHPGARVLILTQYEDRQYIMPLLEAGASGYLPKRCMGADLVNAIRAVANGEAFLYPSVASAVVATLRHEAEAPQPEVEALTPRELDVLRLIVQGATNAQVAARLALSVKTVEWHRSNLMSKLGVHSVTGLVHYAIRRGLADDAS